MADQEVWGEKPIRVENLPESASPWANREPSPQMAAIRKVITGGGLTKLTPRERRAFCEHLGVAVARDGSVTFCEPRTLAAVAERMGIGLSTAQEYVARAAGKLRDMCHGHLDD